MPGQTDAKEAWPEAMPNESGPRPKGSPRRQPRRDTQSGRWIYLARPDRDYGGMSVHTFNGGLPGLGKRR